MVSRRGAKKVNFGRTKDDVIETENHYILEDVGTIRFNELQRRMPEDMTHTTLSRQLKALEEDGMIIRTEYAQIPPKVEYSLSEIGMKFHSVLTELEKWGNEYIAYMKQKQEL